MQVLQIPNTPETDPQMNLDGNPLPKGQSPLHGFRDDLHRLLASRQTTEQPPSNRMFNFVVGF